MSDSNENMVNDVATQETVVQEAAQEPIQETVVQEPVPQEAVAQEATQEPVVNERDEHLLMLEYIKEEQARLEKERASLESEKAAFAQRQKEKIESTHLTNVSTFFWLHYLFNMTFIGFISSIVFSFAGSNISRKNYARARLIWHLIRILCIVLVVLGVILLIKNLPGGITDIIPDFVKGKIKDII